MAAYFCSYGLIWTTLLGWAPLIIRILPLLWEGNGALKTSSSFLGESILTNPLWLTGEDELNCFCGLLLCCNFSLFCFFKLSKKSWLFAELSWRVLLFRTAGVSIFLIRGTGFDMKSVICLFGKVLMVGAALTPRGVPFAELTLELYWEQTLDYDWDCEYFVLYKFIRFEFLFIKFLPRRWFLILY